MTKFTSALFALAALLAVPAYAQLHQPGEDSAAASTPASKAERQAARAKRLALSREMAKKDEGRLAERPTSEAGQRPATADERVAARARRKATGAEVVRSGTGRVPEAEGTR